MKYALCYGFSVDSDNGTYDGYMNTYHGVTLGPFT